MRGPGIGGRVALVTVTLLGVVGAGTTALGGLDRSARDSLTVRQSRAGGASKVTTIPCSAGTRSRARCARIARLARSSRVERCLQIWGGGDRTVIAWAGHREVITRANSCEIARAKRLATLVD